MEKKSFYSAPAIRFLDTRFEVSFLATGNAAGDPLIEDDDYIYNF